ncbi:hypothetical protein [Nocardia asiatica]|uniref:hypothetical protein n=1 Tax=Nocardia asiatica TaxID=209252 RepID=UPI002454DCA1|nr:hypothetical protein [Nocardia asiatica]
MTAAQDALTALLREHSFTHNGYGQGWCRGCRVPRTTPKTEFDHDDLVEREFEDYETYARHLAELIEAEVITTILYGCRSHLGDEWDCDDQADAQARARSRGGVVISRPAGPITPHHPPDGFCGAEFTTPDGTPARCERSTHVWGSRNPGHMLLGFPHHPPTGGDDA